ncbi:MAG: hypothetical protein KQJ78_17530 [Deltaproteobacteria bacterium]|nr:hypothetical protein [Deltaproteobacteria bacterium]
MEHVAAELAVKLREMYPEINEHKLDLEMEFKPDKDYWVIKLQKGDRQLHTLLDKKDADACLEGVQCVYLGVQIGQFVKNFETP